MAHENLAVVYNHGFDGYSDKNFNNFKITATAVCEKGYAEKLVEDFPQWFELVDIEVTDEVLESHFNELYLPVRESDRELEKAKKEGRLDEYEKTFKYGIDPLTGLPIAIEVPREQDTTEQDTAEQESGAEDAEQGSDDNGGAGEDESGQDQEDETDTQNEGEVTAEVRRRGRPKKSEG